MKVEPKKEALGTTIKKLIDRPIEAPRNPRTDFTLEVFDQVAQRDSAEDDMTPPYRFFSEIQGRIARAQSGHGPVYDRMFEIIVIATAACESMKRREQEPT